MASAPPKPQGRAAGGRPVAGEGGDQRSRWAEYRRHREEQKRELADSVAQVPERAYEKEVQHVVIDGFNCYRVYHPAVIKLQSYADDDGLEEEEAEETPIARDPVSGQYELPLPHVGPQYFKFIIGGKGAVRESIEKETGATIRVPKQGEADQRLIIRGLTRAACIGAKQRVDLIVTRSANLLDYTHFISIPLTAARDAAAALLDKIEARHGGGKSRGVERSVFQFPGQLHLTLLMLRLYTSEDLTRAKHLLTQAQAFLDELFAPDDRVWLQGLNYMNDDPSEVHVLYLEVARNAVYDKIGRLVNLVSREFIAAGLCSEKEIQHNEKLHATLMNSKWRAGAEEQAAAAGGGAAADHGDRPPPSRRHEERVAFDIRGILADFGDVDLGEYPLRTLELSTLGEKLPDGYWKAEHAVPFPVPERPAGPRLPREG